MKYKLLIIFCFCLPLEITFADTKIVPWPTFEYLQSKEVLANENVLEAINFIKKQIKSPVIFNSKTTNGYPIVFFYQKLLADAYSANNNPVDSINTYREALSYVPLNIITSSPVPYAKVLRNLGLEFIKIGRFSDAQDIFLSAGTLAKSDYIDSDFHYAKCLQAATVYDFEKANEQADKCIELDPNYNIKSFHYAALFQFSQKNYTEAIDTWLLGLHGMPLDKVEEYLDKVLQFWKNISEAQLFQYYETLTFLITCATSENHLALERVFAERVKLQKLYPDLFVEDSPQKLISEADNFILYFKGSENNNWEARTNPFFSTNVEFLKTNKFETQINQTLFYIAEKIKYGNVDKACKILDNLLLNETELTNQSTKIEGWNLHFKVNLLRALIESETSFSSDKTRARGGKCMDTSEKLLHNSKAGLGCLEDVFKLNLLKYKKAYKYKNLEKLPDIIFYLESLFENSLLMPKLKLMQKLSEDKNITNFCNNYDIMLDIPVAYPEGIMWDNRSEILLGLIKEKSNDIKKYILIRKTINILFEGLEKSVIYSLPRSEISSSDRNSINENPLFQKLINFEKTGFFEQQDYERLLTFLYKYGVCIPAKFFQTTSLKDIMMWRKRLEKSNRNYSLELNVICDASLWSSYNKVWFWSDILDSPIEMNITNDKNIWTTNLTIPKNIRTIKFEFLKNNNDIHNSPEKNKHRRIVVKDDGSGKMTINASVQRDFPVTIFMECDARKVSLTSNVFVAGSIDELGTWHKDKVKIMYDDGTTYRDKKAGDNIFTYSFVLASDKNKIEYLYSDGFTKGEWGQGTPEYYRTFSVPETTDRTNYIYNIYGKKIR